MREVINWSRVCDVVKQTPLQNHVYFKREDLQPVFPSRSAARTTRWQVSRKKRRELALCAALPVTTHRESHSLRIDSALMQHWSCHSPRPKSRPTQPVITAASPSTSCCKSFDMEKKRSEGICADPILFKMKYLSISDMATLASQHPRILEQASIASRIADHAEHARGVTRGPLVERTHVARCTEHPAVETAVRHRHHVHALLLALGVAHEVALPQTVACHAHCGRRFKESDKLNDDRCNYRSSRKAMLDVGSCVFSQRLNWKYCVVPKPEEEQLTQSFKKQWKQFDFTLDDEDDE